MVCYFIIRFQATLIATKLQLLLKAWYSRLGPVFQKGASSLDHDKVALLLGKMFNQVHKRYTNYVLSKKPSEITLKYTVDRLNKLFSKKKTQVALCPILPLSKAQMVQVHQSNTVPALKWVSFKIIKQWNTDSLTKGNFIQWGYSLQTNCNYKNIANN